MPTSAKPKSPRGESGPGDSEQQEKVNPAPTETADCGSPVIQETLDPESDPVAAPVVAVSADFVSTPTLTPAERKLADQMTRDIARHLGLGGSSRSVRI